MKPIFSFTGAQCTGKSTLLSAVHSQFTGVLFVPEVTRLVKHKAGVDINENGSDITQRLILAEHLQNVFYNPDMVKVLDRCALDGLVYTSWLWMRNKISEKTKLLAIDTFDILREYYDTIFYTEPFSAEIEDDGERSINNDFRKEILHLFEHYIKVYDLNVVRVSGSVEERTKIVTDIINSKIQS